MNLLTRTLLEIKIGERIFTLECLPDSPLHDVHQALSQMQEYIIQRIEEAKKPEEERSSVE